MTMIETFFQKKLITRPNTQRSYQRGIELYFKIINKDINNYFNNKPSYEDDITKYYHYLEKKSTQMTRKNRINAIKQFLKTFDKNTRDLEIWDTISYRLRNISAESEETPLDKNDLKKILRYGDICSKAMFLIMGSCGCRIGELVQLLPDDIHTDETPTRIYFRVEITKTHKPRDSFITQEATESYKAWMKIRKDYLISAVKKTTFDYGKKDVDDRVFPMTDVNVRAKWLTLVRKSDYDSKDSKTHRLKAHPHSLRKFFRSYLGNADLAEHLMGHAGYLSTYRQFNTKQLAKEYLKYMGNLCIFEFPGMEEVQDSLKEKDQQMAQMQKTINEMKMEILDLKVQKLEENRKKKD